MQNNKLYSIVVLLLHSCTDCSICFIQILRKFIYILDLTRSIYEKCHYVYGLWALRLRYCSALTNQLGWSAAPESQGRRFDSCQGAHTKNPSTISLIERHVQKSRYFLKTFFGGNSIDVSCRGNALLAKRKMYVAKYLQVGQTSGNLSSDICNKHDRF